MDAVTRQYFLDELCPRLRTLIECVMDCDCGCEAVDFFRSRSLALAEARDIAAQVRLPLDQVLPSLDRLVELGIVERVMILNEPFYGLTRDPRARSALEQFWLMRDDWRGRMEQTRATLLLRIPPVVR